MVLKMVGEEYFYEDAVNMTYSDAYQKALEESGLEPVDRADVELKDVTGEGYTFVAKVTTRPEVTLGEYKGLSAVKPDSTVTDEEVQGELDRMLCGRGCLPRRQGGEVHPGAGLRPVYPRV